MYNFVLQIIVFSSLGIIIFLMARALPRVSDSSVPQKKWHAAIDKWLAKIPTAKIDSSLNSFLAKILRKFRVLLLKIDNFVNHRLGKISKRANKNSEKGPGDQQLL